MQKLVKKINMKKNKNFLILCNLYIKSNLKNTLITLTKKDGKVLKQWSTKSLKKTKFKKNTSYNIYLLILKIINFFNLKKIKKINIFIIGNSFLKKNIINNFNKKKIKILNIFDKTLISFNGCKKKKIKRR
jgi:small subunit ribosomal protein S11